MADTPDLQTSTEELDKDRVKLRVEAPEGALGPALDAAYRRWAKQIKVAGFRKGKVPRQIIDARVGAGTVRSEALEDALPEMYRVGIRQEEIEPIAPPEIDIVTFEAGSPIVFEATIDTRPEVTLPDLASIAYEAPGSDVTDEEVDAQLDRLRDRFAELETVGRPVQDGDYALIDLNGTVHGNPVEGASQPDFLYEVGSRTGPSKLDAELAGSKPGEILRFSDTMTSEQGEQEVSFTVLVKEVKGKKLPPLDDELAKTMGEFDTLDELKDDLRTRLSEMKANLVEEQIRSGVLEALLEVSELEPPEKLVEAEFEHRIQHLNEDLKRSGLTMADYESQAGVTELELRRDLREQAARSVKAELLLEEVAREQEIEVTEEDMGAEIGYLAARGGSDPNELAKKIGQSASSIRALASDVIKRKALDHVVEAADVTGRRTDEG